MGAKKKIFPQADTQHGYSDLLLSYNLTDEEKRQFYLSDIHYKIIENSIYYDKFDVISFIENIRNVAYGPID